jgi:predicted RNase H-like HicB family nuclease
MTSGGPWSYGEPVTEYRVTVVIEQDEDGYVAFSPELQGCYAQGETWEEAMAMIQDAIRLHLEDRAAAGDPFVPSRMVGVVQVNVVV